MAPGSACRAELRVAAAELLDFDSTMLSHSPACPIQQRTCWLQSQNRIDHGRGVEGRTHASILTSREAGANGHPLRRINDYDCRLDLTARSELRWQHALVDVPGQAAFEQSEVALGVTASSSLSELDAVDRCRQSVGLPAQPLEPSVVEA